MSRLLREHTPAPKDSHSSTKVNMQHFEVLGATRLHHAQEYGASISNQYLLGETPLHAASSAGDVEVVKRLLERGADINAQNVSGNTPAHKAIIHGHLFALMVLLNHGADVNLRNSDNMTLLSLACYRSGTGLGVIDLLLKCNADVDSRDCKGRTPLHLACLRGGYVDVMTLLKRGEAGVNLQDRLGDTPAHKASLRGHNSALKFLIRFDAEINQQNCAGMTPLHLVCQNYKCLKKLGVVNTLLKSDADVNIQCNQGNTALHVVSHPNIYQSSKIYEKLLDKGALCVDVKNNKGKTPYDLLHEDDVDIVIKKTALEKHVVKLKTAGIVVDYDLNTDLDVFKDIKNQCLQELKKLKTVLIRNPFSLNTIFVISKTPRYLKNPDILRKLEEKVYSKSFNSEFPLYGHILQRTYEKARRRMELLETALGSCFSDNRKAIMSQMLPDLVKCKILQYLNNHELNSLIESGKTF